MNWKFGLAGLAVSVSVFAPLDIAVAGEVPLSVAAFVGGNKLWEYCKDKANPAASLYCQAYVTAAIDAQDYIMSNEGKPLMFCVIEHRVTVDQATDVVRLYLQQNPAKRSYDGPEVVFSALHEAFQCTTATSQ